MGRFIPDASLGPFGFAPTAEELEAIAHANACDNPIEEVMRLRALVEISQAMDSESLMGLARLAARGPRTLRYLIYSRL